jgi:hypothetical protein
MVLGTPTSGLAITNGRQASSPGVRRPEKPSGGINTVSTTGFLLTLVNVLKSMRRGRLAGDNPWEAPSLEWRMSSPPPSYAFLEIPVFPRGGPEWEDAPEGAVRGLDPLRREVLITNIVDASPDHSSCPSPPGGRSSRPLSSARAGNRIGLHRVFYDQSKEIPRPACCRQTRDSQVFF